jgi:hypothetical protein
MKLDGPDELAAILDDIVASIGEILVIQSQLKEGMVDDAATDAAKEKLDRLKQDTLAAKTKLADIKQRQQHKRDLERQRREREAKTKQTEGKSSSDMLTLRDAAGKVVGYVRVMKNRTEYFSPTGKLVAREIGGATYDFSRGGRLASRDRQGLRVLGRV